MSVHAGVKSNSSKRQKKQLILYWLREWSSWLLIIPTLLFFFFFAWQPLFSGLVLSFFKTQGFKGVELNGLQNYMDVIQNSVFQQTLINTFLYVFWSLIFGFFVPVIVAIIINEMRHGSSFFRFSVYFPSMVPGIAAALMWMFLFNPGEGGVLNIILDKIGIPAQEWLQNPKMSIILIVLTITWRNFGGATLLYLASLQGVNNELYEAASIDGAGIWRKFRSITLPQIAPMISLMLILQISGVFQVFNEPLIMTEGGPSNASMSLMLQSYFYAFRYFEAGHSLALGVITFVILMILTIYYFKLEKKWEKE
ncbi:ABC transporter [Paenibacillus baekrokdamisoli]|uniref:ABC transporter n=1 Tax=Paenibacillus baekrokdamisoli TaxID=1712516 RepID=A0A3G9JDI9_9BACL|nr:sugar ABC transporter permease [Paenibacillus baekrokdamisoli]MBB3073375.1 multiple sugar transport system permease protein [Paenibacillus baekrokdamisoli]BBH22048.1 ABC transporter [Paenibacillus baekrokdamisoli]